jgi:pimeloyl-ACP methyl ester carboxylesterase
VSVVEIAIAVVAAPFVFLATLAGLVCMGYLRRALFFLRFGPRERVGMSRFMRILVFETLAIARVIGWWLSRRGEDMRGGTGATAVFIHGLSADGTSLYAFRKRAAQAGRATYAPHLGYMLRPIERYAERLAAELSLIDGELDIVAHSMGGIVLRRALVIEPALCARIRRVVTIASPHRGTGSARFLPTPEARQLVPGCEWLERLPSLRALLPSVPITTIGTDTDAIVYPEATSRVEGATHHALPGLGHTETLVHPRIVQLVMDALT